MTSFKRGGMAVVVMLASMSVQASEVGVETIEGNFPLNPGDRMATEDINTFAPDEKATYEVEKGDRLSEVLQRWCNLAGYDLVWQPGPDQGDLEMAGSLTFNKSFKKATEEFMGIVRQQSKFDAQLHPNDVLRVFVTKD